MTTRPDHHLQPTTVDSQDSLRIEVRGDLDYASADLLVAEVTAGLSGQPALTDLHLSCAGLGAVDSMGLSALLMIGRRTGGRRASAPRRQTCQPEPASGTHRDP